MSIFLVTASALIKQHQHQSRWNDLNRVRPLHNDQSPKRKAARLRKGTCSCLREMTLSDQITTLHSPVKWKQLPLSWQLSVITFLGCYQNTNERDSVVRVTSLLSAAVVESDVTVHVSTAVTFSRTFLSVQRARAQQNRHPQTRGWSGICVSPN